MAKKNFDNFLSTVKAAKISPDEIEAMTREIHHKTEEKPADLKPAAIPAAETRRTTTTPAPKAAPKPPAPRGRKPKEPELERTIRVSVDLPESVLINLKIKVTREQTDMKNFIRQLVERELRKEFG